jgi:ATP-dependent DNA helicase RecQ
MRDFPETDDTSRMPVPSARDRETENAPNALSVLNSVFGLPGFRGAQEEIVRHVTNGGNCLVLMPTGGGKSLCYQLPSLLRKAVASWSRR